MAPRSIFDEQQTTGPESVVGDLDAPSEMMYDPVTSTMGKEAHEPDELPTLDDFHHSPYRLNLQDDTTHQIRPFIYQRPRTGGLLHIDTSTHTRPPCK